MEPISDKATLKMKFPLWDLKKTVLETYEPLGRDSLFREFVATYGEDMFKYIMLMYDQRASRYLPPDYEDRQKSILNHFGLNPRFEEYMKALNKEREDGTELYKEVVTKYLLLINNRKWNLLISGMEGFTHLLKMVRNPDTELSSNQKLGIRKCFEDAMAVDKEIDDLENEIYGTYVDEDDEAIQSILNKALTGSAEAQSKKFEEFRNTNIYNKEE